MSHPTAVWQAEFKPYQLEAAVAVGLTVPTTVITNDPVRIREMFLECGSMVVKPVRSGYVVHAGQEHAIYTSRVLEQHLELERRLCRPSQVSCRRFDFVHEAGILRCIDRSPTAQ
jgi:glutathione synthase/RimK-type ligase-like ATP-grasp enzyme